MLLWNATIYFKQHKSRSHSREERGREKDVSSTTTPQARLLGKVDIKKVITAMCNLTRNPTVERRGALYTQLTSLSNTDIVVSRATWPRNLCYTSLYVRECVTLAR